METSRLERRDTGKRRWIVVSCVLISVAAVALLATAFGPRLYTGPFSAGLLTAVLIALSVAIGLHVRFLILARREHRETASALDATEREFKSIFDSALDGILILDDRGICLEANPAAQALFGTQRDELIGETLGKFYAAGSDFVGTWQRFLDRNFAHGETQISRKDGQRISVEYTAKAHYLPGRHVAVLRDISQRRWAETALRESEERFQQMAGNIQEIFWMLDAEDLKVVYVNQAYEAITGRPCESLREDPRAYEEVIHPEDRVRVLSRLDDAVRTGQFDEEFRIVKPDNAIRWVWVRGFPVRDSAGVVRRLVGTAQDVSARKSAEAQMARNLDMAESARAEADAFRKTTLALTQNLSMDYVLDTLLQSLVKLIPCESARVLLVEADARLFLAREVQNYQTNGRVPKSPVTLDARESQFLLQVLTDRSSVLISNTAEADGWKNFEGHFHLRSWLCVPLVASQQVLGLLSLGDTRVNVFSTEHMRLAKSLAIPAAVAIQNARLYERAEIYGTELEQRLADLDVTRQALRLAEEGRTLSEERFTKVFRSSPIAFCITTLDEGRFLDVNDAFERRYGYARKDILGRTVLEVSIWNDPNERREMLAEIRTHGRVRNRLAHFRKSSGDVIDTIVSTEAVDLDGRQCLLTVSEDLPNGAYLSNALAQKAAASR